MNWGHRNFQSRALPTELSRQKQMANGTPLTARHCTVCVLPSAICRERAMRFELTTFSLARRRSTTELRPQISVSRIPDSVRFGKSTNPLTAKLLEQILPSWRVPTDSNMDKPRMKPVDPVGFEPTIFSLQRRRLPARLRARKDGKW